MPNTINRADLPFPDLPEVEGQGGINIDDVSGGKNILLRVGPYNIFTAGDKFDVYWGTGQTLVGTAVVSDEDDAYFAFVDLNATLIRDIGNGTHEFFYRFTSAATGIPINSPLPNPTVRVKLDAPGDPDSSPNPVNPNLVAPTVVPLIIDSEQAEKGATVTIAPWVNMADDDTLTLLWGSEALVVDKPTVGQPVVITVPKETILAALDNPELPVRYRIRDTVGNSSKLSPSTLVNVQATVTFFDKPKVLNAPGDILDLDQLGGDDVKVQVDPEQDGISIGDTVILSWVGVTGDGTAQPEEYSETVTGDIYVKFTVPNAVAAPLAQGSVTLYYSVNGRPSKVRHLDVIGETRTLEAPWVQEAKDGALSPADVTDFAHIQIDPYPGMGMGDRVTYYWKGLRNGESVSFLTDYKDVSENDTIPEKKPLVFTVPKTEVEALDGAMLEIYYVVELYGQGLQPPSPTLTLSVGEEAGKLPEPEVDYVVEGVLNPADAPDGTNIRVTIAAGARAEAMAYNTVRFFWTGNGGDNSFSDAYRFTAGREVVCPIAVRYITGNLGQSVVASYQLEGIGEPTKPSRERTFEVALSELFEDFEGHGQVIIPVGGQLVLNNSGAKLTNIAGSVQLSSSANGYPPMRDNILYLSPYSHGKIECPFNFNYVYFDVADGSRIVCTVIFWDENDTEISRVNTPPYNPGAYITVFEHKLPVGLARSMSIIDGGGDSFIDNLTMGRV